MVMLEQFDAAALRLLLAGLTTPAPAPMHPDHALAAYSKKRPRLVQHTSIEIAP